jgi:NAD(P)-dependent dehydrogenase (short-subunit alcohol dehydrogenase family)
MPSEGAGAAAGAGLANTTIADGDIATAVAVLQALGRDEEAFFSKRCQALRRALGPLQQLHESRKFGGMSHEAYNQSKQQRLQETMSRQKQRMLEKEFINKTQLRAARLAKLAQLSQQDDGSGTLLLIPDGVADDSVPLAPHLLMDASPLPVAGEASSSSSSAASSATPAGANGIEAGSADGGGSASGDPASGAASGPAASSAASSAGSDGDPSLREPITLERTFRACYSCKRRYQQLHAFYATFCPTCAAFNWAKRHQTADLSGRVALVTGARVKIGFQVCLKLLRAGCEVVATSRFPHDAAERYAAQPDFASWSSRLHVFGVDLRDLPALEAFCEMMHRRFNRLDVLINNACQTVRRPPAFYAPLLLRELTPLSALPPAVRPLVAHAHEHTAGRWSRQLLDSARGTARVLLNDDDSSAGSGGAGAAASVSSSSSATPMEAEAAPAVPAVASAAAGAGASALAPAAGDSSAAAGGALLAAATGVAAAASAAMSQLAVVPGDEFTDTSLFPTGACACLVCALQLQPQLMPLQEDTGVMRLAVLAVARQIHSSPLLPPTSSHSLPCPLLLCPQASWT